MKSIDLVLKLFVVAMVFCFGVQNANAQKPSKTPTKTGTGKAKGAVFDNANLKGADLRGAKMQAASFRATDLTGAKLDGAILTDAKIYKSNTIGVSFDDWKVRGAAVSQW